MNSTQEHFTLVEGNWRESTDRTHALSLEQIVWSEWNVTRGSLFLNEWAKQRYASKMRALHSQMRSTTGIHWCARSWHRFPGYEELATSGWIRHFSRSRKRCSVEWTARRSCSGSANGAYCLHGAGKALLQVLWICQWVTLVVFSQIFFFFDSKTDNFWTIQYFSSNLSVLLAVQ